MNSKQIIFSIALIAISIIYSCSQNKKEDSIVVVNIPEIANKTPAEVEEILGKPDSTFTQYIVTTPIFTHIYKKHRIEIQYPQGKATDIVINKPFPLPYDKSTLQAFGIKPKEPTHITDKAVMRWENVPGFDMISFYVVHLDEKGTVDDYKIYFKSNSK